MSYLYTGLHLQCHLRDFHTEMKEVLTCKDPAYKASFATCWQDNLKVVVVAEEDSRLCIRHQKPLGIEHFEKIKDQDQTVALSQVKYLMMVRTWVSCSTWGSVQAGWRAARDFVERCSTLGFSIGMSPTFNPAHSTNCQIVYVCLSKGPGPNLMVNIPLNDNA